MNLTVALWASLLSSLLPVEEGLTCTFRFSFHRPKNHVIKVLLFYTHLGDCAWITQTQAQLMASARHAFYNLQQGWLSRDC